MNYKTVYWKLNKPIKPDMQMVNKLRNQYLDVLDKKRQRKKEIEIKKGGKKEKRQRIISMNLILTMDRYWVMSVADDEIPYVDGCTLVSLERILPVQMDISLL